jgi:hypothetical protein
VNPYEELDWSLAPEWAAFAAMDADGEWYWYENAPHADEAEGVWLSRGRSERMGLVGDTWLDSAEPRP